MADATLDIKLSGGASGGGALSGGASGGGALSGLGGAVGIGGNAALFAGGPAGVAIAALAAGAGVVKGFVEAIGDAKAALLGLADRLAPFSADIGLAKGAARARAVQGQFARAGRLGPELAQLVDSQSRVTEAINDIKTSLLEPFLPLIAELADRFAAFVEQMVPLIDEHVVPLIEDLLKRSVQFYNASLEAFASMIEALDAAAFGDGKNKAADALRAMEIHLGEIRRRGEDATNQIDILNFLNQEIPGVAGSRRRDTDEPQAPAALLTMPFFNT